MKHLLVIADQQGGNNSALQRAIKLQQLTGAKITLLGFCFADIHKLEGTQYAKLSRNALENKLVKSRTLQLQATLATIDSGASVTVKVLWSKHIAPAIIAHCQKSPFDYVLKSANKKSAGLRTSTDWQLIRECPAPVFITASKSWKKKPNIIASIDLDTKTSSKKQLNDGIIQQAKQLAEIIGAEVYASFVITVPQALVDMDIIDSKVYARNKKAKLQKTIDEFCLKHAIDKQHLLIKQGRPEKIIPNLAGKLKAETVVTGTVGRKGLRGKLLGNTAEAILQNLHTDIITIRP